MDPIYIILIIIGAIFLAVAGMYNLLVRLRNRTQEAWSDIDVQLKRRYNLIPNLIETVKEYAEHEKEVFTKVTKARNQALNAEEDGNPDKVRKAENNLEGALKSLFAVAESYPDLKANANFMELQRELADTENKIQAARRFYNTTIRELNTKIESFPYNLFANTFNFKKGEYFEISEEQERAVPKVDF